MSSSTTKSRFFFGLDIPYLLSEWKEMFRLDTLTQDLWAGTTVALVALPLNLALAIAAGVEPPIDFALAECKRLTNLFPGLLVVPFVYNVENDHRLFLISNWLAEQNHTND